MTGSGELKPTTIYCALVALLALLAAPACMARDANSPSVCEDRWSNFLPLLGREACERGYVLPRPFGVSLGYMHQDQPFDVGDVLIGGIDVKSPGVAVVDEVQNEETTLTLRLDAWILPFWNVYGMGTTLAGGYGSFFAMIDANYTEADLDISRTDAEAVVISTRAGWTGKLGEFTGILWAGAMYQDIDQAIDLEVDLGDARLPVVVEQSTSEPLNYLLGGQWNISRSFSLLVELGLGKRDSQMLNLTYRF